MRKSYGRKGKKPVNKLTCLLVIAGIVYMAYVLFSQQVLLDRYTAEQAELERKLAEERDKLVKLQEEKQMYNSDEFVERVAREKLGLVYAGEQKFIDVSK